VISELDQRAAVLTADYLKTHHLAVIVHTDGREVRIITPGTMDASVAKVLHAAADTMANRAYEAKQCKPKSTN